jgi:demethylspheroidene O-methyltransferase
MTTPTAPRTGRRSIDVAWRERRDRLLADPRFRDAASRFIATRPLAQRHARELFDLMAGFVYSQVLFACVQLGLFERLARGPVSAAALAGEAHLGEEAAERLLEAAAALRLTERRGAGEYGLGILGATLAGNEALTALIEHHRALYDDMADPLAMLRRGRGGGALARYWAYATSSQPGELPPEQVAPFSRVMAASQPLIAQQVLDAYPLHRHRCLLDVGGGHGAFVAAALQRTPGLQAMLMDLPAVVEGARERLRLDGLLERVRLVGGDFRQDPLPEGADVISIVRVLYDHDDEPVMRLLRAARAALPAGGTLLVAEPMAETPGSEPMGAAYFGMYLWAMGSGRIRSATELASMLGRAGFQRVSERRTALPLQTRVLVARAGAGRHPPNL